MVVCAAHTQTLRGGGGEEATVGTDVSSVGHMSSLHTAPLHLAVQIRSLKHCKLSPEAPCTLVQLKVQIGDVSSG